MPDTDIAASPLSAGAQTVKPLNMPQDRQQNTVNDWVRDRLMSASVNKTTVGVESARVTPELMLATSKKLIKLNKREVEPDAKDSLEFQRVYGPSDYFAEHVLRDANRVGRQLLWKATNRGNVDFMPVGALDQHVSDVFNSSKAANMIDGSSPLETVEASMKVSRIGEGGIGSIDSAPTEMRLVQPSFLGYIDPVRSVESLRVGLDAYLTKHCKRGTDGKLYQKFINAHTGKEELVDSVTAAKSIVTTPEMMKAKTNHIFAVGGKTGVRIVDKKDVDYYLPRMDDAFTTASNMVTGLSGVKELRLLMGCLHPLTNVITYDKKNMAVIQDAKSVNASSGRIAGAGDEGLAELYQIRTTVSKFPMSRAWFKKVVLYSGRALVTSRDHRWPVLRGGKLVLVQAEKLKEGDKVLRSTFKDAPNRRTFINNMLVTKGMAVLLGYIVRSLANPEDTKLTVSYQPRHKSIIEAAIERLGIKNDVKFYQLSYKSMFSMRSGWFYDWVKENIGVREADRCIPPEILSSYMDVAAAFIDAYTADETLVGIDSLQYTWILAIPNTKVRDGLAYLLARMRTDTLYRDSYEGNGKAQLALKLTDMKTAYGDCIVDEVKAVQPVPNAAIMVDIDINDNMYAVANGIITHNSKYPQQAVSIEGREPPLVRNIDEQSGKDLHSIIGRYLGARYASKPGTVTAVRKDRIDMIYDDGTKGSIALYRNFPMNAKGYIDNIPQVKAGMHLNKGDLLASSNYTDDKGTAATGTNLRVGWMSWKGGTYEDAIVLSESAAKKLTSTTMYSNVLDLDKTIQLGKSNYTLWKPGEYSKEQLSVLDNDGIVRPGTVLHRGDPMVLAVQTTEPSPGTMGKRILTDLSETWEHDHPGTVTDVVRTRKGVKVLTTVTAPVEVGDKISGCFDDDTEIFTRRGFVNFNDLQHGEEVAVMLEDGTASWEAPFDYMEYRIDGPMYKYKDKMLDFMVTPNHRMLYVSKHDYEEKGITKLSIKEAQELGNSAYYVTTAAPFIDDRHNLVDVVDIGDGQRSFEFSRNSLFDVVDFAAFLGIYLAEGHVSNKQNYVYITQDKKTHGPICNDIEELLDKLCLRWTYTEDRRYVIHNPYLHSYLKKLGHAQDKYIPEEVFDRWPVEAWRKLIEWHYKGDGDKTGTTRRVASVSYRLIRDLQRLHVLLGDSCTYTDIDTAFDAKAAGVRQLARNFRRYRLTEQANAFHIVNKALKTEIVDYHGYVHCVSTKAGRILVCRNGKPMWCGNCYGNKGVVSQIYPDDQMPCDKDGKPLEMLLSPLGLVTRCNPAQMTEALLGKVAKKTGKYEIIPAFYEGNTRDYVMDRLKRAHLNAEDDFFDPETGRKIPGITNGYSYIHKLKHLAESKLSARGTGEYTSDDTPGGSGMSGSKRYGGLEISAMAAHGAFDNLLDLKLIRGQSNSDFWRSIRTGGIPTIPGEPLVQRKFFAYLKGAGVNVRKTQKGISVFPLSNSDVREMAGPREVKSKDTYEAKNFRPIDGGLFGQDIFGMDGDRWGYIQLDEPVPNPVMAEPLARLLRMSDRDFTRVASGSAEVNGLEGGTALREKLKSIDLDKEAKIALEEFKTATASKKDAALKRYVAVERMRRQGLNPSEYMLDRIPVLPPTFRPVTSHNGLTMVADANYLYAQLLDARDDLRDAKDLPKEYQDKARQTIYRSWQELNGMYDPEDVKLRNKDVGGLLQWALGKGSPKFSGFQRKVLGSSVDTVGRGSIIPDSKMTIDEVGIPVRMAFGIMAPFVERELVKRGYTPIDAMKMVKKETPQAFEVLKQVIETHPVQMNRAPTLHKFNILAFKPRLVSGHAIHIHPSVCPGFNADFDGDSMQNSVKILLDTGKIKAYGLTNKKFNVYYSYLNQIKGDMSMITSNEKCMLATLTCALSEVPTVEGSEVSKSNTVTEWDVVPGIKVYTIDPATGKCVLSDMTKVSRHTGLKMFDCVLSSAGKYKHTVTVSEDHSLITLNPETMSLEKTRPEDAAGRCVPRMIGNDGNTWGNCIESIRVDGKDYHLGYDFGLLLGMILGDGWIDCHNTLLIAGIDPDVQAKILELTDMSKGLIPVLSKTAVLTYTPDDRFSSDPAQRIDLHTKHSFNKALKEKIGEYAWGKKIPAECIGASKAHLIGLLVGMLATDGTVNYSDGTAAKKAKGKTILIHTTSPLLRDNIQDICGRLGIKTSATPYRGVNSKRDCYAVVLSVVDVARVAKENKRLFVIPMRRKQDALERIIESIDNTRHINTCNSAELMPVPRAIYSELSYAKVMPAANLASIKKNGYMTKPAAEVMVQKLKDVDWSGFKDSVFIPERDRLGHTPEEAEAFVSAWIQWVEQKDVAWEHVDSVTPSTCTEGWDCTVPGPYTFTLSTGTVIQDTVNIHVPVSDNARRESMDKMRPSRNLIALSNHKIMNKPEKEYMQGLYIATRMGQSPDGRARIFRTLDEARQARRNGEIDVDTPIQILET